MGSLFAHFQVQALLAVCHAVTVSLHAVKLLYTVIFQWGLEVATHCCVVVHQCFFRDQPDTTEIRQIQLDPAVTWHGGQLKKSIIDRQVFDRIWPFADPFCSLELSLVMSTRSSLPSHGGSTQTVMEKVCAFYLLERVCTSHDFNRSLSAFF